MPRNRTTDSCVYVTMDRVVKPLPAEGDTGEFESFYAREYSWAVRLAVGLTGDGGAAEELVQDTFIRIRPRLGSIEHPHAYLRTAVANAATSWARRATLERRSRQAANHEWVPSHLIEFRDVLSRLPVKQRVAIVLRYLEDLDDDEIAAVLACRRATVRSLVHRGLANLREELK